jgi:hypothetical protein
MEAMYDGKIVIPKFGETLVPGTEMAAQAKENQVIIGKEKEGCTEGVDGKMDTKAMEKVWLTW